jgi:hypothetical protein
VTTKTPVAKAIPLHFRAAAQSFVIKECRSVNREFFTDVDTSFRANVQNFFRGSKEIEHFF